MNTQKHKELIDKMHETYIQKNRAYGNSFDKSCDEYGITAAMVRMSDKWNRLNSLAKNSDIPVGDESMKDTLLDLANYCLLTYMWLEKEDENRKLAIKINNSDNVFIEGSYTELQDLAIYMSGRIESVGYVTVLDIKDLFDIDVPEGLLDTDFWDNPFSIEVFSSFLVLPFPKTHIEKGE